MSYSSIQLLAARLFNKLTRTRKLPAMLTTARLLPVQLVVTYLFIVRVVVLILRVASTDVITSAAISVVSSYTNDKLVCDQ